MDWTDFTTDDDGPPISGRRAGSGPPVLLLHGAGAVRAALRRLTA